MQVVSQFRSFNPTVRFLMVNQLTINAGFYMLMPYLANHLSGSLGLAAWLVGLILGIRNFSQQGMFLVGGSLADRIGYKPMIMAGCALRVVAFAMLGFVESTPGLIVASALTGLAGALFNPAVRAYLTYEAEDRRVEAFSLFNVFYQTGILVGPLVGIALSGISFQLVCVVASALFGVLTILQIRALPAREGAESGSERTVFGDWREAVTNRAFLLFAVAMMGSYLLSFQVYLTLPLEVRRITGSEVGVSLLFTLSAVLGILGQLRITAWFKARLSPAQAIAAGLGMMGFAWVPLIVAAPFSQPLTTTAGGGSPLRTAMAYTLALTPVMATTALLSLGTLAVFPFEMAMIVSLGRERLVGTYYGLYNLLSGIGIAAGNLLSGAAVDAGRQTGITSLPWIILALIGTASAIGVLGLHRSGRLTPAPAPPRPPVSVPTAASR
ncbi:MAG: MFS transporter [Egibacteraceae bacterium]